jgi:hypothetical protein
VKPIPTPKNVVTHLRAMHDRLKDGWANVDDAWWTTEAAAIIERLVFQRDEADAAKAMLKAERDEARREVCAHESNTVEGQYHYSAQRGWHCFASLAETARESYKGGD